MKREKKPEKISGDDDAEVTPVPMPNTEVKLCSAENTWWEAAWEDRSLPEQRSSSFFMKRQGEEENGEKREAKEEEKRRCWKGKKLLTKW